jgi:hypothetical protein
MGGLPVLGMPLSLPILLLVITIPSMNRAISDLPTLISQLPSLIISLLGVSLCTVPFCAVIAVFATWGTYIKFTGNDAWLNKIVHPGKEESPDIHEYL